MLVAEPALERTKMADSKDERRADRTAKRAEKDLVLAKEWAKGSSAKAHQEARRMARAAKRRRAKANRRAVKASIRDIKPE